MHRGKSNLLNKKHLSATVQASFPNVYNLLPLLPEEHSSSFAKTDDGTNINLDFSSAQTFKQLRLIFPNYNADEFPKVEKHIQSCLDDAVRFKVSSHPCPRQPSPRPSPPPSSCVRKQSGPPPTPPTRPRARSSARAKTLSRGL